MEEAELTSPMSETAGLKYVVIVYDPEMCAIDIQNVDNLSHYEVLGILHDAVEYWGSPWFWREDDQDD